MYACMYIVVGLFYLWCQYSPTHTEHCNSSIRDFRRTQIQIYNTNTDSWNVMALQPAGTYGGSMAAVLANGIIYYCGGIANGGTINNCNTYNMGSNSFGSMAPLIVPVNHAAYAWDGQDKIYVIGGRYDWEGKGVKIRE